MTPSEATAPKDSSEHVYSNPHTITKGWKGSVGKVLVLPHTGYSVHLCPHNLQPHPEISREAKRKALEDDFRDVLNHLAESKELIRQSALLQHAQNQENAEAYATTKQPDFYFEDWNGREYLADLKNIWYYPILPWEKVEDIRFYRQSGAWIEQNVSNKKWDAERYTVRQSFRAWDSETKRQYYVHDAIKVKAPWKINKVYVGTIPSLQPSGISALKDYLQIYTGHPIHLPLTEGYNRALLTLQEGIRDLVSGSENQPPKETP